MNRTPSSVVQTAKSCISRPSHHHPSNNPATRTLIHIRYDIKLWFYLEPSMFLPMALNKPNLKITNFMESRKLPKLISGGFYYSAISFSYSSIFVKQKSVFVTNPPNRPKKQENFPWRQNHIIKPQNNRTEFLLPIHYLNQEVYNQ